MVGHFYEQKVSSPTGLVFNKKAKLISWGKRPFKLMTASGFMEKLAKQFCYEIDRFEDGFIRSYSPEFVSHSIIRDTKGMYYDQSNDSDFKDILDNISLTEEQVVRAQKLIARIGQNGLSKYSNGERTFPYLSISRVEAHCDKKILVVEQLEQDAALILGGCGKDHLSKMVAHAKRNHPNALVVIKKHPRSKVSADADFGRNVVVLPNGYHPFDIIDFVDEVYVATSQMGMEALLLGKKVTCFGKAFYSGLGLTTDLHPETEKREPKTVEELFFAAYIEYTHYFNPYTMKPCQIEDTMDLIELQIEHYTKLKGSWRPVGFSGWKTGFLKDYMGPEANVLGSEYATYRAPKKVAWASKDEAVSCDLFVEDGFLRSKGLGANLIHPISLAMDNNGIYFDATWTSDLEEMLNKAEDLGEQELNRAREGLNNFLKKGLSKYNLEEKVVPASRIQQLARGRTIVLALGQVEADASIRYGSPEVKSDNELLARIKAENPDSFVLYKPHPEVVNGVRENETPVERKNYDYKLDNGSLIEAFAVAEQVHVITSLAGMEALMHGCDVHVWGIPFYAGWGLTKDRYSTHRRKATLTLEALFYCSYLKYPAYLSLEEGEICDFESAMELIDKPVKHSNFSLPYRILRKIRRF